MRRLFDAYIMVDWSAASKPVTGVNSIWVGVLAKDARFKFQFKTVNLRQGYWLGNSLKIWLES